MARKTKQFIPPTFDEVRAYIIESGCLKVDANEFIMYYATNDWRDSNNKPLKVWKLKVRYWQMMATEMGRPDRKCHCGKYGEYIGKDDTGQIYWRCAEHKPVRKFVLPSAITADLLKSAAPEININDERNRQIAALKGKP